MQAIRVLIADDNAEVLRHVSRILSMDFQIVGALPSGEDVLHYWRELRPDVMVLDISMGTLSGIDVAQRVRQEGCESRVVFLTLLADSDIVEAAMATRASAYVLKACMASDLIPAIRASLAGAVFYSPRLQQTG